MKAYPYKDCPFCGGKCLGHQSVQGRSGYFAECLRCGVEMRAKTLRKLLCKWNRRKEVGFV